MARRNHFILLLVGLASAVTLIVCTVAPIARPEPAAPFAAITPDVRSAGSADLSNTVEIHTYSAHDHE